MNSVFMILLMIFCHIIADYNLQGWLATAKQKSYWQENAPDKLYKYDYICALIMHSIGWAFMIMLPLAFDMEFNIGVIFMAIFAVNVLIHAIVDHMKANAKIINLWQDQFIHFCQIAVTASIFLMR
jgi:hypothetical protein